MRRLERLSAWLDERTGHVAALRAWASRPMAGGARWSYAVGPAIVLLLFAQVVTGLLLMTAYAPSAQSAWASVHYVSFTMSGGWLVRGMHRFASDAVVVLVGLHLFQAMAAGAYARPREVTWWLGLVLFGIVVVLALTGALLPWDQHGYWARRVETNILGSAPIVGPFLQTLVQGGAEYGSLTLTRFYALHVGLLPALLAVVLWAHGALARKHGNTPPGAARAAPAAPYYPNQVARNVVLGLVALAVVVGLTLRSHGASLDAPADPNGDYPARPEWYLLWMFRLLHSLGGQAEGVVALLLPAIFGAYLFVLPRLDRDPGRPLRARLGPLAPAIALGVGVVALTVATLRADARDGQYQGALGRAAARAAIAIELARGGVPPAGPLAMLRADPGLRGEDLFAKNCAACHVLGGLGDDKKASAPALDGWSSTAWLLEMMHDPDAHARFGPTPYKGEMPSMDVPPKDHRPDDPPFKPMTKQDMQAAAVFLYSEGASEGDQPKGAPGAATLAVDEAVRKAGEKIVTSRCTTCHLFRGEGDDGDQELAPELAGYGSVAWVRAQVGNPATKVTYRPKAIDDGKSKGHMPAFAGELTAADLDLVSRWMRARARGIPLAQAFAERAAAPPAVAPSETKAP